MDLNYRFKPYMSGDLAVISVEMLMMGGDF